jgi:iron complex transport system substrate-binding protein
MPCGYSPARAAAEFSFKELPSSWDKLPAIRYRRVFAVDANSYFSRPGPRLSDGIELLAHLFHPQIVRISAPDQAFQEL